MWETNPSVLRARLLHCLSGHFGSDRLARVIGAADLAAELHQTDTRDDGTPYLAHPLRTALILVDELGIGDTDTMCVALLHDTLEDYGEAITTVLEDRFGTQVSNAVRALSKPPDRGRSRDEINQEYFPRIRSGDERVRLVKLADRLDNVRDLPTCPDAAKRARMLDETRTFYTALVCTIRDPQLRAALRAAYDEAVRAADDAPR
jgi:(p)ppGpp synthase/HD superfamily hydrolase